MGFRQALSQPAIDKTLRDEYLRLHKTSTAGTIERMFGVAPIIPLLLSLARRFFTPAESEAATALRALAPTLSFYDVNGAFKPATAANKLAAGLCAVLRRNAAARWDAIYRSLVPALARAFKEEYFVVDDDGSLLPWSPFAVSVTMEYYRRGTSIPYLREDVERLSDWLTNFARLDDVHAARLHAIYADIREGSSPHRQEPSNHSPSL